MKLIGLLREFRSSARLGMCFLSGWFLAGCGREDIRVYTAPKEQAAPPPVASKEESRPRPQLAWKLPEGWREVGPGQMSLANFAIPGVGGREANVTITPLALLSERDAEIVNMWRAQMNLEPISPEEAAKQFQTVEVGAEQGKLFEVSGHMKDKPDPMRIITAMVHRPGASWFYKLAGEATLVELQKTNFIEFLKSIRIKETAPSDAASSEAGTTRNWQVPGHWKQLPPGQMQVAKFSVPERGASRAEVFVSVFPNDTGGLLANVNRWRRQIGLSEVGEGELSGMVSTLDPANPRTMMVEMTNSNKRLIGAIVPRGESYWFYKLLGDDAAVAPEKESFVAFAKSNP